MGKEMMPFNAEFNTVYLNKLREPSFGLVRRKCLSSYTAKHWCIYNFHWEVAIKLKTY